VTEVKDQNGSADFRPRIMQRPKEIPQKVTILKRPDSSSSISGQQQQQMNSKPQKKSLEQREKEYAEARRRILGSDTSTATEQIM
jgi:hypothetical protein